MKFYIILLLGLIAIFFAWHRMYDPCTVYRRIQTEDGIIEIVDEKCQEGLPHTSNSNTIRMTQARYDGPNLDTLLTHERVHLDQKRNPEKWRNFYKQVWDYDILKEAPPSVPSIYKNCVRPNPDTSDSPWAVWKNRYVFFPNYGEQGTLRSARVYVWDLVLQQQVGVPEQWKSHFCERDQCPHQIEHPHELSAEYIASNIRSDAAKQVLQYYNNPHK